MQLHYLMYISTAKKLMTENELFDVLEAARAKNKNLEVTGMLLYSDGTFIQALEGEKENIDDVYASIVADTRHKNVIKLIEGVLPARIFPSWQMGFASINAAALLEFEGFINPANPNYLGNNDHAVITMLKVFAESNRLTNW